MHDYESLFYYSLLTSITDITFLDGTAERSQLPFSTPVASTPRIYPHHLSVR